MNVDLASGSTYTISFLMKKTGSHTIGGYWTMIIGAASGNLGGGFDVSGSFSSGVLYSNANVTNRIRRVEQWGTNVYRCSETFTMTASGTLTQLAFAPIAGVTNVDNSASGTTMAFAAPQIELGAVPTSFIPTTTASATRAADVCSVSGVSGYIGQTEGTLYAEVDYKSIATTKSIIAINDGTTNNRIQVRFASTTVFNLRIVIGGVDNDYNVTISPALSASGSFKVALAYKQNDYVLAVNGSLYASTASRNVPACTNLTLGNSGFTSEFLNDRIRAAAIYTTRLSNDQLANITRLT